MITLGISEFRVNMKAVLTKVQEGEIIILTSRDVEVAKVVPPDFAQAAARIDLETLRETAEVGDVISPVDASWNA